MGCQTCGGQLKGKQVKFCSTKCKLTNSNTIHQLYQQQRARGLLRKIELVSIRGGGCEECGYRDNLAALCFHHVDESLKSFDLDLRALSNRKMTAVMDEFSKCIVLCQNCHTEHHNPNFSEWYKK